MLQIDPKPKFDDIYAFLGGIVIGTELFPSLNLSYWEPSYPNNIPRWKINRRKEYYLESFHLRCLVAIAIWVLFLSLIYPTRPLMAVLIGGSLIVSFSSRYNFRTMRKYATLTGFHLIAFLLLSLVLYERFEDPLVFVGPALALGGGYLIGESRNQPGQEDMDLLGRALFGVGFTLMVISIKAY